MKKMRLTLPLVAFAIALLLSAFTVKQHGSKKTDTLFWYVTTYDAQHPSGYIPNSSAFYVEDDKADISSPCSAGTAKDCLRGFSQQLSSFPETSVGMDQIKKP